LKFSNGRLSAAYHAQKFSFVFFWLSYQRVAQLSLSLSSETGKLCVEVVAMEVDSTTSNYFAAGKTIVVAGAGIAGLSFALALRQKWPSSETPPMIIIYERDTEQSGVEREGYSISIRSDGLSGGMQALQKLGVLESMLRISITGIQGDRGGFSLWDTNWIEILKVKQRSPPEGLPVASMRIARYLLRRTLLEALSSHDTVRWATACTGAIQLPSGQVQVQLSNGQVQVCDFLIAADGANSRLRRTLRPDDNRCFAGAVCITGNARVPDGVPKPVTADWGLVLGGGGTGLFVSPIDQHSAVWSLSYLAAEPRRTMKQPIPKEQVNDLLEEALDRGKAFAEPFESLVRETDPLTLMVFNAMDKQPFPHNDANWKHLPAVFIGDSSHAISPFAGNGANMALMDGVELAEQISKSESLDSALARYDASSITRSKSAIRTSRWVIAIAHAQGWKLTLYILLLKILKFLMF
jgi:2-polyprenyl-6-methoxyphenol hydroxylase-like FAD-dependent oxidoreductase